MIGLAIFRDALSMILSGFRSSWVYIELLEASRKDHHECLKKLSLALVWAPVCLSVYYWTGRVVDCFYQCTVKLIAEVGPYSSVGQKRRGLCWWRRGSHLLKTWLLSCLWNAGIALDVSEREPCVELVWNATLVKRGGCVGSFRTRASFALNAKVTLDHSGCGCHWKRESPQCHASARFKLEICVAYLGR